MKNNDEAAFPVVGMEIWHGWDGERENKVREFGLTKRELFAAMIHCTQIHGNIVRGEWPNINEIEEIRKSSIAEAEDLLLELAKEQG